MSKMSSLTAFVGAAVAFTLSAALPAPPPAGAAGVPSPVRPGAYRMPKVPGNLPLSSRFYAVDQGTSTVDSFSGTSYLMSITSSLNTPCCAIVGPYQFLHVLNLGTNQVTNYTPGTNTLNRVFGTGLQNPDPNQVIGIDGYVTIYVLDLGFGTNSSILEYPLTAVMGTPPAVTITFANPDRMAHRTFAVSKWGVLFAQTQSGNNGTYKIAVFKPGISTVDRYITLGNGVPSVMRVDPWTDSLYVADAVHNVVSVYPPGDSKPIRTVTAGISAPSGIFFRDYRAYVANAGNNTVTIYDNVGNLIRTLNVPALGTNCPSAVVVNFNLQAYASCTGGNYTGVYEFDEGATTPTAFIPESYLSNSPAPMAVPFTVPHVP
jgi:hypothetical protein